MPVPVLSGFLGLTNAPFFDPASHSKNTMTPPAHQTSLRTLTPAMMARLDYWEHRASSNSSITVSGIGADLQPFSFDVKYDPTLYPGSTCSSWCAENVTINTTAAVVDDRMTFPTDNVADWSEKCSWDAYCAGCSECAAPAG